MAKINTTSLAIYVGGTKISALRGASITLNNEMIDITTKDSAGWKEIMPGLRSGNAEVEGLIDDAATYGESDIWTLIDTRASATLTFTTNLSAKFVYTIAGYLTNFQPGSPGQEDAAAFSASFEANGAVTRGVVA